MRDPSACRSGLGPREGIAQKSVFQSEAAHRRGRKIRKMPDQPMRGDWMFVMCNLPFLTPDPVPGKDR